MTDLLDMLMDPNLSESSVDAIVATLSDDALARLHKELEPDCTYEDR